MDYDFETEEIESLGTKLDNEVPIVVQEVSILPKEIESQRTQIDQNALQNELTIRKTRSGRL